MFASLVALTLQTACPTLDEIYTKVAALPGVQLSGEMVRPSTVAMEFRIAPGGRLWARYPTSEQFISGGETVTWMPDRRQYAKEKQERGTPTPGGYESMWPGGERMTATGTGAAAMFAGQAVWMIPCRSRVAAEVSLFVSKKSLLPIGTIAKAGGTTYEIRYQKVEVGPQPEKAFRFVPPADAKPYTPSDPTAKLPKQGDAMPAFAAKDLEGRATTLSALLKGRKGLVVNFWFSACTGCVQELPVLAKLGREYPAKGVGFIGVNPIDPISAARRTLKLHGIPFPTIAGVDAKKIAESVGVVAYPVTVVLNADGKVVDTLPFFDEARLMKAIEKISG